MSIYKCMHLSYWIPYANPLWLLEQGWSIFNFFSSFSQFVLKLNIFRLASTSQSLHFAIQQALSHFMCISCHIGQATQGLRIGLLSTKAMKLVSYSWICSELVPLSPASAYDYDHLDCIHVYKFRPFYFKVSLSEFQDKVFHLWIASFSNLSYWKPSCSIKQALTYLLIDW